MADRPRKGRSSAKAPEQPMVWKRADPTKLARFDPNTKVCTMNCGPHADDPRTTAERKLLCDECFTGEA